MAIGARGTAHKHRALVPNTRSEKSHKVSIGGHVGARDVILKKDAFNNMCTYEVTQANKPEGIDR